MWGHTTNNTLCIVWFAVCYNASQYSCVEIADITPMNSPQLQYLPVMFPPLGNMLLLLEVFIFTIGARSFCLNLENFFLSALFTSLIFIVNKFDNKYWRARIFYQIYWQTDIFYITFLSPNTSHLAFRASNIG